MSYAEVVQLSRELFLTSLILVAPAVLASLFVGVLISILQTVTSIQEQTLSFAPRIVVVVLVTCITLPWSLEILVNFASRLMLHIAEVAR